MYISRFIEIFHIDTFYKYIEVKKYRGALYSALRFFVFSGEGPG